METLSVEPELEVKSEVEVIVPSATAPKAKPGRPKKAPTPAPTNLFERAFKMTDKMKTYMAEAIHCGYEPKNGKAVFDLNEADALMSCKGESLGGIKTAIRNHTDGVLIAYDKKSNTLTIDENLIEPAFEFSASLIDYEARPVENVPYEIDKAEGFEFAEE